MKKRDVRQVVIKMPDLGLCAAGKFWFWLPVPFMYFSSRGRHHWPFKKNERLLVTVERAKPERVKP